MPTDDSASGAGDDPEATADAARAPTDTDDSRAPTDTDDSRAPTGTDDTRAATGTDDSEASAGTAASQHREEMAAALREIRREGWKAATIQALVEASAVFLVANLVLTTLRPGWLPSRVPIPDSALERINDATGWEVSSAAIPGSATLAAGVAFLTLVVGVWLRVRRPLVEQFEAVNPAVAESLRTARDAVAADAETRMAARLYENVQADLRSCSSVGLVDGRRVGATAVVIVVLSLATLQVAVVDLALLQGGPGDAEDGSAAVEDYSGLEDGNQVLGARENVSAGDDELEARVESTGGGHDVDEDRQFPSGETTGSHGGSGDQTDGQQAGYAAPEEVEDAELVREYNKRIREVAEEDNE